jgi:WD40 repeat protein
MNLMLAALALTFVTPAPRGADVPQMIEQLGSEEFYERQAASRVLGQVGEPALPALRKAAVESDDWEVRKRAGQLVVSIENRVCCEVCRLTGHEGPVVAVAFSPDGKFAVSGGQDGTVRVWDVAARKESRSLLGHGAPVNAVAFSPDGRQVLSGGGAGDRDPWVRLWDLRTVAEVRRYKGHETPVHCVAFSPDGTRIAYGTGAHDGSRANDCTVRVCDRETGKEKARFTGHTQPVVAIGFSSEGSQVVSASPESIWVWTVATGKGIHQVLPQAGVQPAPQVLCQAAISSDSCRAAAVGLGGQSVTLWCMGKPTPAPVTCGRPGECYSSVAISADGSRSLAGTQGGTLVLWDAAGHAVRTYRGHSGNVRSVAFSPDGKFAVSGGQDGTVRVWRLP